MIRYAWDVWTRLAVSSLLAGGADLARIDADELAELLAGQIAGADATTNATLDPDESHLGLTEPDTPYDVLVRETGGIARDFRDLALWDRLQRYDPKIYGYPADKSRAQSLGVRDWTAIDTVIVHTAAADLHEDRGLGVPSHALVARNGRLVLQHYLNAYLPAAHRANSYSVSLEISGHRSIAAHQIPSGRAWVRFAVAELRRKHAAAGVELPIKIGPHAISHSSRINDCDSQIHRAIVEPSIDELGLQLAEVVGSGRPIPRQWWSPGRPELAAYA